MTDTAWGGRGAERAAFFQEAGLTCLLIHCFPLCQQRQTHSLSGLVFPVTCEVRAHPQQLRGGSGSHTPSCPELRNWTSFSARPVMGPPGPSAPLGSPLVFPVHKDVPTPPASPGVQLERKPMFQTRAPRQWDGPPKDDHRATPTQMLFSADLALSPREEALCPFP